MCISMRKKSNVLIFTFLLLGTTSCSRLSQFFRPACTVQESVEIPCTWHSSTPYGVTEEDPSCYLWWETLNDPALSFLIQEAPDRNQDILLAALQSQDLRNKAKSDVNGEIARNVIEYRGLQMRLKILDENRKTQEEILSLNKELSDTGFYDIAKENENKRILDSFAAQRSLLVLSTEKNVFRLATLLNYPPRIIENILSQPQDLPDLKTDNPIGSPEDILYRDPSVTEARKLYRTAKTKQSLYHYQKTVLDTLERAENALATFRHAKDKVAYAENAKNLKADTYRLITDLYNRGFKDTLDVLQAHQEVLSEEDSLIQTKVGLLVAYIEIYHALSSPQETCCK